ncbi:hypothetical protein GCM10012275_22050 [Longimycelium tulufanense]|uniref:FAD-binding PCMH-type domain-containing protein n=1 Tax=Longimycelium tulufanense TaxID=907463 RepID=A0A8J3CAH3_9PSEU|nr:cholesterol oxidase substrate-binding domain-containing protein [Longimycelium tulufanense]GGM50775.1 hypothetical protein GCM10012275_22050 [Longimycelium tulufanense]
MRIAAATAVVSAAGTLPQWRPVARIAEAAPGHPRPPGFPDAVELYRQAFENWSGEFKADDVWTCSPRNSEDLVRIANWARGSGWTIRPRGQAHGWSPLAFEHDQREKVVLVDLRKHFTGHRIDPGPPASVTVQAGMLLDDLLTHLQDSGLGVDAGPAPGDVTVGGALAIGAHGTGISTEAAGKSGNERYGSLSNLIVSLKAIVWNAERNSYEERQFHRQDPAIAPLLVHLGRVVITEATLRVGQNRRLRCQSFANISAEEIFARPERAGKNSLARILDSDGMAEVIWFPYTVNPWLKVWSAQERKPAGSRQVRSPYNYGFSDNLPEPITSIIGRITAGAWFLTPTLMNAMMSLVSTGLFVTGTQDIWGWSKDVLLYVRPTTLRVTANGYAVLTRRRDIQRVVSDFYRMLQDKLERYRGRGAYPMNGPLEVRVTELDDPSKSGVPSAVTPLLSAIKPSAKHPDFDVAVWFDVLTIPGTAASNEFFREIEGWVLDHYSGDYALVRPEWSKGWAYGTDGAWTDHEFISKKIPTAFGGGTDGRAHWDRAAGHYGKLDPHGVFAGGMHQKLFRRA